MNIYVAQIEVWNGRTFQVIDFQMADSGENFGTVIREYVAAMGVRLIYWCKL